MNTLGAQEPLLYRFRSAHACSTAITKLDEQVIHFAPSDTLSRSDGGYTATGRIGSIKPMTSVEDRIDRVSPLINRQLP